MNSHISIIKREDFSSSVLLSRILELHDVPELLYIIGNLPEIILDEYGRALPRILTVIGSRKHTHYGKQALEKLLASLSGAPVIILSGLAYGIDGLAHATALKHNIVTLAIPGSGLDKKVLYPSTHIHLAEDIVSAHGALISELAPLTSAAQWTFPARNRIMAALSDAVLVIEAEEKSGTLITTKMALELGRDIGAIPGELFSPTATGTNRLIKDGAYMITNEEDLYSLLHLSQQSTTKTDEIYTENELCIMNTLSETLEKDTLLIKSNLPLDKFLSAFSSLEIRGCIKETFGEVRRLV